MQTTLETIAKVLDRLKQDDTPHADEDLVVQALRDCEKSLQEVEQIIARLQHDMESGGRANRVLASFKAVNKESCITKIRDELYKAQLPLMLAIEVSTRSVILFV